MPICDLLGGRVRDTVRVYAHAGDRRARPRSWSSGASRAQVLGSLQRPVQLIHDLREALGDDVDLMIDVHGPPWFSVADAIRVGQELEEYDLLFYEDPVPPENVDALAKVAEAINVPLAAGERYDDALGLPRVDRARDRRTSSSRTWAGPAASSR